MSHSPQPSVCLGFTELGDAACDLLIGHRTAISSTAGVLAGSISGKITTSGDVLINSPSKEVPDRARPQTMMGRVVQLRVRSQHKTTSRSPALGRLRAT